MAKEEILEEDWMRLYYGTSNERMLAEALDPTQAIREIKNQVVRDAAVAHRQERTNPLKRGILFGEILRKYTGPKGTFPNGAYVVHALKDLRAKGF